MTHPTCAGFCCINTPLTAELRALAESLDLPILDAPGEGPVLAAMPDGLAWYDASTRPPCIARVDFASPSLEYRQANGRIQAELLAKAVGKPAGQRVVDATAGFGRDAFLLAALGHDVTALERVAITAALLADGVRRAAPDSPARTIRVIAADAAAWLNAFASEEYPDVIYCDPIFPDKRKTAAVKKEMQAMRLLAGPDADADALLAAARAVARKRVIVKRWANVAPLAPNPSFSVRGKTIRYDVYLATT